MEEGSPTIASDDEEQSDNDISPDATQDPTLNLVLVLLRVWPPPTSSPSSRDAEGREELEMEPRDSQGGVGRKKMREEIHYIHSSGRMDGNSTS